MPISNLLAASSKSEVKDLFFRRKELKEGPRKFNRLQLGMVHQSARLVSKGIWTLAVIFLIFPQELSGKYCSSSFFQVSLINPSSDPKVLEPL